MKISQKNHLTALILIARIFVGCESDDDNKNDEKAKTNIVVNTNSSEANSYYFETINGSHLHSPDGTWWGYNMKKIARFGDKVYTYYIDNKNKTATGSSFVVMLKDGNDAWKTGASFATSRPGNILIDSAGVLHAFVYAATDYASNDSVGKLLHYWFPKSNSGDITTYEVETVVDHVAGQGEQVNIRIGAAIGADDTLAIAFGLGASDTPKTKSADGQSQQIYFKRPGGSWQQDIAGTQLGHDFYYPFLIVTATGFVTLPVQDDYIDASSSSNVYQIIPIFEKTGDSWTTETLIDLTSHSLASTRPQILEQSELYQDVSGSFHIIYKQRLGDTGNSFSEFVYLKGSLGSWETKTIDNSEESFNWIRIFEVENTIYYLATSYREAKIAKSIDGPWVNIELPNTIKGAYLYVNNRSSSPVSPDYTDALLISGDSGEYPDGPAGYLRIPHTALKNL